KSPWTDLLFLILLTFASIFCVSLLLGAVGLLISGNLDFFTEISNPDRPVSYYSYLFLGLSSAATFILPAYIFQRMKKQVEMFPKQNLTNWKMYLLGILFLFAFAPCMSLISEWNANMRLPEIWRGI